MNIISSALREVTWYSRLCAFIIFVGIVPTLSFYIGTQYQNTRNILEAQNTTRAIPITVPANDQNTFDQEATENEGGGILFLGEPILYINPVIDATNRSCQYANPTNVGETECKFKALALYEADYKKIYANVIASLDATIKEIEETPEFTGSTQVGYYEDEKIKLQQAHEAFALYRENICRASADTWTSGTGAGLAFAGCNIYQVQREINDLCTLDGASGYDERCGI